MFNAMLDSLKEEAVGFLFNLQVEQAEPEPAANPEQANALPIATAAGNGHAAVESGRHSRPTPQQPVTDTEAVPTALRGKGLGAGSQRGLTFSGPGEDGLVESHADGDGEAVGGTRRERRAAQRASAKKGKKGPRR
jgi:preprotein translocase subunit SecA